MKIAAGASSMAPLIGIVLTLEGCSQSVGQSTLSGIDESFLDHAVSPCTDFYQFACGTWIKEHPTDTSASIQRFYDGDSRNSWLLERILEDDRKGVQYIPHPDAAVLGSFYGACMASRSTIQVDHTPLNLRLQRIASVTSLADLAPTLASLHADGVGAFFYLFAAIDPGNPARGIATIAPNGIGLPDRAYYLDPSDPVLGKYQQHMEKLLPLYDLSLPVDTSSAVISVETALAEAMMTYAEARDPVATYNMLSFDAFTAVGKSFPWASYFTAAGAPTGDVNVTNPAYLMKLDALLATTPLETLKSYLRWRVLEAYAFTLGKSVVAEEAAFHYGVFRGDPTPAPDWWACLGTTKWALGFALSHPFVAVRFDSQKRDAALGMVASLKRAFRDELASRTWLDDPTHSEAEAKLDEIVDKVGFPETWPETPAATFQGSFTEQVLSVSQWVKRKNLEQLSTPVDRSLWRAAPCVTNAFYSASMNDITFPAAILQTPEFDAAGPNAINFGAMGAIMGHELTHGFDDVGRHFDGKGKLRDWWTVGVGGEFTRRATCIAEQYSAYEPIPGLKIDGQLTLGENIADLGGLRLAHRA